MPTGRYEIAGVLGAGGMGRVLRAVHRPSGRAVAIKVPHHSLDDGRTRRLLLDEAAAAARLRHPRIVELLDVVRDTSGRPGLVMELVEGHDLGRWAFWWPGWHAVAAAFDDVLAGLVAAHGAGIIHRDLKPGNLLRDGEGRIKITDFGVAEVVHTLSDAEQVAAPAGTPAYMAPEQFRVGGRVGPWTDLYAVGVMLFELIVGRLPFDESTFDTLRNAKRAGAHAAFVPRTGLSVPGELVALVASLLDPDPRRRPRFASTVRDALARAAEDVDDHVPRSVALPAVRELIAARATALSDFVPAEAAAAPAMLGSALDDTILAANVSVDPGPTDTVDDTILAAAVSVDPSPTVDDTILAAAVSENPSPTVDDTILAGGVSVAPNPTDSLTPTSFVADAATDAGALHRLRTLPVAGRRAEREVLARRIDEVCAGGGVRVVAWLGEAGVGKSRLAHWGLSHVEEAGRMEGVASGYDLSRAETGAGLRHAIQRLLGASWPSTDVGFPAEWTWLLADGEPLPFSASKMLAWLAPGASGAPPGEQVVDLAAAALRAVGRVRPVYLWLDDVGWSSDGALELARRLVASQDASVLFVLTLRSGTADHPAVRQTLQALAARPEVTMAEIEPLDTADRAELLASIVPLAPGLAPALAEALDETPLLLVQRMYDWIETGLLVQEGDEWVPAGGRGPADLISSRPVHTLLGRRIEALVLAFGPMAGQAEGVLHRAALLGQRFEERALRAASTDAPDVGAMVDAVLDRALLQGLLRVETEAVAASYRFEHGLLQETLLERLRHGPTHRAVLHQTAEALLSIHGDEHPEAAARAADLFREAGEADQAWKAKIAAAMMLLRRADLVRGAEQLSDARRWLDEDRVPEADARRAELLGTEAVERYFALDYARGLELTREAGARFARLGDERQRLKCRWREASIALYANHVRTAERIAREVCEAFERLDPTEGHRTWHLLAQIELMCGRPRAALASGLKALKAARLADIPRSIRSQLLSVAEVYMVLEDFEAARALLDEAASHGSSLNDANGIPPLFYDALTGRYEALGERLPRFISELDASGGTWWLSALLSLDAFLAAELDARDLDARIERFVDTYQRVSNDEPLTHRVIDRTAASLRRLGRDALAERVERLLAERRRVIAEGQHERDEDDPAGA